MLLHASTYNMINGKKSLLANMDAQYALDIVILILFNF